MRSIVETINSVEKRKFGDELRNRLLKTQIGEMKVIDIVYNIQRYINYVISVLGGFLQSLIFEIILAMLWGISMLYFL